MKIAEIDIRDTFVLIKGDHLREVLFICNLGILTVIFTHMRGITEDGSKDDDRSYFGGFDLLVSVLLLLN